MSANLIVGKDPSGNKTPVAVDANGAVVISGTVSSIGNVETILNNSLAVETVMAADVAAIKSGNRLNDGSGNAITSSTVGSKRGVDVNIIAGGGGGGGGGGVSAQFNTTLPTYNNGDPSTLQTDVNGRLITTGPLTDTQLRSSAVPVSVGNFPATQPVSVASLPLPSGAATESGNLATIADEAVSIDNKLPSLSSGRVPVEANIASGQTFSYTNTGAVAANTVLMLIDCSQFKEISVQVVAYAGVGIAGQISNDGVTFTVATQIQGTSVSQNNLTSVGIANYQLLGARFFRLMLTSPLASGTNTLVAIASQQATPKLHQSISGTVGLSAGQVIGITPFNTSGFSTYHTLISAASTNATSVKTSQGVIGTCVLTNTSTTFKYVKFFNLAVAPTMGTSTPVIQFPVAPNSTLDVGTAFAGFRLATGIAYAITNGSALLDNTAVGAGEVLVNLTFT